MFQHATALAQGSAERIAGVLGSSFSSAFAQIADLSAANTGAVQRIMDNALWTMSESSRQADATQRGMFQALMLLLLLKLS